MHISLPKWAKKIAIPARYKILHGGRGGAKSWTIARMLLIMGTEKPHRMLCLREVQKSIKQSVHKLLSDQIETLGLGYFYEVLETCIRGRNGTEFSFAGLSNQTTDSLKSYEGITVAWIEEGQSISSRSLEILIPTIRVDGSEIWVSMNPYLDTDEAYKRFIETPPPDSIVLQVNYSDNPWFPNVLEQERLHHKETNSLEDYENIWEGKCRSAVEGAIYAQEVAAAFLNQRICNVPHDPLLKVHTVWDLGWNDSMFISIVQRVRSEIRIIKCIKDDHKTLQHYVSEIKKHEYDWGYDFVPHDGKAADFKTGLTTLQILEKMGRRPRLTPEVSVEAGIKRARMMFHQVYFDRQGTTDLVESLKRYRRQINAVTMEAMAPLHDAASHGSDNFRYIIMNAEKMSNEDPWEVAMSLPGLDTTPSVSGMGY